MLIAMVVTAALAAVSSYPAPGVAAPRSGVVEMVHSWWFEPVNLNPVIASEGFAWTINVLLFDGLIESDENNIFHPALAERWIVSPDGRRYTFFLRKDVTWHDGRPFTAEDVAFTIYAHLNPKVPSLWRGNFVALEGFEQLTSTTNPVSPENLPVKPVVALDKHTVVFRLKVPFAPFLTALETYRGGIVPKHLLDGQNLSEAAFNKRPVGTGPFRLVEWRPGERLVLEANEKYYRGRPKIDRLILRIIPDRTVEIEELKKGTVHFSFIPPVEARAELEKRSGLKSVTGRGSSWSGVALNQRNELFQDRRVREALMHAIDVDTLIKVVYLGYASRVMGPITPAHGWAFSPTLKPYEYNVNLARRLLAEAGWTLGGDGVLQKGGKRLSFRVVVESRKAFEDVVVFVQEQWRRVGVEIQLDSADRAATYAKVAKGNYEAYYRNPGGPPDPDFGTYDYFYSKGAENTQGYSNPRVDQLLDRGRSLVSVRERAPVYHELQKIFHEDLPWIWLASIPLTSYWSTKFTGFSHRPANTAGFYYNMHLVGLK